MTGALSNVAAGFVGYSRANASVNDTLNFLDGDSHESPYLYERNTALQNPTANARDSDVQLRCKLGYSQQWLMHGRKLAWDVREGKLENNGQILFTGVSNLRGFSYTLWLTR